MACTPSVAQAQTQTPTPTALDRGLEPAAMKTEEINRIYTDMIVVQRKARVKKGMFLFNPFMNFDFSDGPTTMYGINLNLGYAFSEEIEFYVNYVPSFISNERKFVGQVSGLTLQDGNRARISYAKPQSQYGLEFLWAPAYGKDSWGHDKIIRSDTFLKFGGGVVRYDADTGSRFTLMIGKTFFFHSLFNFRIASGGGMVETPVNQKVETYVMGLIESGIVWYL